MTKEEMDFYELIKSVRKEFKKIANDPEIRKEPFFRLKSFELELNVVASKARAKQS